MITQDTIENRTNDIKLAAAVERIRLLEDDNCDLTCEVRAYRDRIRSFNDWAMWRKLLIIIAGGTL